MLSLFSSYCRNQQFVRSILRKSFTSFCFSDQDIQKHIKILIELREKKIYCGYGQESEQLSKFRFLLRYELFRKHLIKLAYYSQCFDEFMCKRYIKSAQCGNYLNHYQNELMQQVFLAELYDTSKEFAIKSLTLWQNIVENNCQFYKQWKENKSFDIDAFTKNPEIIYYDQYLECYVAVLRKFYEHGVFETSKTYFKEAEAKILEALEIIQYFKEEIAEMKDEHLENHQEYITKYEIQFQKHLVNSCIVEIKISLCEKNQKYGKEMLEKLQKKKIANQVQIFHLKILKFNLESLQKQDIELLPEIILSIFDMFKNIEETQQQIDYVDKLWAICEGFLFLSKIGKFIEKFKNMDKKQLQQFELERLIINNCFNELIEFSQKYMKMLAEKKYTKHYFWDNLIFSFLFALYREKDVEILQINIHAIQNNILPIIERPLQKIIEFFQLIVELEIQSEINQVNQDLLKKIEQIEFKQLLLRYQKQLALKKIYKNYNLKQDQQQKKIEYDLYKYYKLLIIQNFLFYVLIQKNI